MIKNGSSFIVTELIESQRSRKTGPWWILVVKDPNLRRRRPISMLRGGPPLGFGASGVNGERGALANGGQGVDASHPAAALHVRKIIPTPLTPRLPCWDVAGDLPCPSATLQEVGLLSTGREQTMEFEEITEKDLSPRDGVGCPSPSAALAALPVRPPTPQAARLKMSHPLQRGRGRHLRSLGF